MSIEGQILTEAEQGYTVWLYSGCTQGMLAGPCESPAVCWESAGSDVTKYRLWRGTCCLLGVCLWGGEEECCVVHRCASGDDLRDEMNIFGAE